MDVKLNRSLKFEIERYFQSYGFSQMGLQTRIYSRRKWYRIGEGEHIYAAFTDLSEENPAKWDGFLFPVLLMRGGAIIQTFKELARSQDERYDNVYYMETKLFDRMYGRKKESDSMCKGQGRKYSRRLQPIKRE